MFVIASVSEAIQLAARRKLDCFVASLLAMTASKHTSAFSRRGAPEVCYLSSSPSNQRAQGRPGARCTRGLVCNCTRECAHEHTGEAESIRPSLRNGFTAYAVISS